MLVPVTETSCAASIRIPLDNQTYCSPRAFGQADGFGINASRRSAKGILKPREHRDTAFSAVCRFLEQWNRPASRNTPTSRTRKVRISHFRRKESCSRIQPSNPGGLKPCRVGARRRRHCLITNHGFHRRLHPRSKESPARTRWCGHRVIQCDAYESYAKSKLQCAVGEERISIHHCL